MRIYQRTWKDPDGETRTGRTWWVQYVVGGVRVNVSTGTRDKRAAELIAGDIVRKAELKRAGIADPYADHLERSLDDHLTDFLTTLRARNVVAKYVKDREDCLTRFLRESGAKRLKDFTLVAASKHVEAVKATGVGARSVNRHVQALKQFGRWLETTRRIQFDPVAALRQLNEAEDRRHVRRALTPEEAQRLIDAARTRLLSWTHRGKTVRPTAPEEQTRLARLGETRALIYALALGTGLRKGEIRRLRWCDLDLERGLVTVTAASAKSRRVQTVDLHESLVAALKVARPRSAAATDRVVPPGAFPNTLTLHRDLEAAAIAREDDQGRVVDFHALRTTFVSWLAATGAHPRTAQALARHSSIDLTMNVYTDLRLVNTKGAVDRLPLPAAGGGERTWVLKAWNRRGKQGAGA
jgi:integrase